MKILYLEPYYSGSHKQWINNYKKFSKNKITILGLKGSKWKWRMHGGAVTLANKFLSLNKVFDLIICSDMLNLPVFKSLCIKKLNKSKIVTYFHENQLSYPWSPHDPDITKKRDLHYAFINYSSSLVADHNFFNSYYHKDSYISALKKYLNKMPDLKNKNTINEINNKSSVLHVGCNLNININQKNRPNDIPVILWNHRWEYDKNPELFFNILFELNDKNIDFRLVVLGERYDNYPKIFDIAQKKLKNKLIYTDYCSSYDEYCQWLSKSDILPVTSIQDFFGISIIEAVSLGVFPILPNRLSYPELFEDVEFNAKLFYQSDKELKNKIAETLNNLSQIQNEKLYLQKYVKNKYDWSIIAPTYDTAFQKLFS